MFNILTQPLIRTDRGAYTLPGVLAALARDEVDCFPALRAHQGPSWHMFVVQLAGIALRRSGSSEVFEDERSWLQALRNLTPQFSEDEPWHLVIDDWSIPAFFQPPVPDGVPLKSHVPTPDAIDLLITAKNHDLKQSIARNGQPEDWLFALVSLQTGEGYGGRGNQGIARMNGGSASRSMFALAPLPENSVKMMSPRLGGRFKRDVAALLSTYQSEIAEYDFYSESGVSLTWVESWPEGVALQLKDLDIWFIDVCRRVRLVSSNGMLSGFKGNSVAPRIDAKHLNGALGDPFTPTHKTEKKSLTVSKSGFDYTKLVEILFSGEWRLPILARLAPSDAKGVPICLMAEAIVHGNSKTDGFKSRILPINGERFSILGTESQRLNKIAKSQIEDVDVFNKAIGGSLALAAAGGDRERRQKEHYKYAREAQDHFDQSVDSIFFKHLWEILDAQDGSAGALDAAKLRWSKVLYGFALTAFDNALPGVPCAGVFRPRAESRARRSFIGSVRYHYPELFEKSEKEGVDHAA